VSRKEKRTESGQMKAAREWIEKVAKDTRSPGRLRGQRLLFETDEQQRLWGVQKGKGNK
jgi:hypothetical protein